MKRITLYTIILLMFYSCNEDVSVSFSDKTLEMTEKANVNVSYPEAIGTKKVANRINSILERFLAEEINMSEKENKDLTLDQAIKGFNNEYENFKKDFSDSTQQWEASIEAEVNFDSKNIVCISINSYLDTGGAHGNSHVSFLNFDKKNGELLSPSDIFKDKDGFKKLAQPYFEKATRPLTTDESEQSMFFGEAFQLPENIGFNNNGVILLYNVYDIASYAQGITEFTIPYAEVNPYLKITLE